MLESARQAKPRDLVRRMSGDVRAAETDGAAAAIDAADAIEHAGLASAVGADQRKQLARNNGKRHVLQHAQAAKAQTQMGDLEVSHTTSATGDIASQPGMSGARRLRGQGRIPVRLCCS